MVQYKFFHDSLFNERHALTFAGPIDHLERQVYGFSSSNVSVKVRQEEDLPSYLWVVFAPSAAFAANSLKIYQGFVAKTDIGKPLSDIITN
jgi:hypothetical protein